VLNQQAAAVFVHQVKLATQFITPCRVSPRGKHTIANTLCGLMLTCWSYGIPYLNKIGHAAIMDLQEAQCLLNDLQQHE